MARYLRQLYTSFLIILLKFDSIPATISPDERLARFIFSTHYIKNGKVSLEAFMPQRTTLETSVYRTSGCGERKVWLLGSFFVARLRKDAPVLIARGDILSHEVFNEDLKVVALRSPHPRHAVIRDWPVDKPQQRIKAMGLALKATLHLNQ